MFNEKVLNAWLESENVSDEFKFQIKEMSEYSKSIAFSNNKITFGTAGYRAKLGPGTHLLNKFTYSQFIFGYAKYLKSKYSEIDNLSIVIGTDNRKCYKFNLDLAIKIMTSLNINVYVLENHEPLPTPMISFLIRKYKSHGGINITASHNPKEYNGIKFYNNLGSQLLPEEDEEIISNMMDPIEVLSYNPETQLDLVKFITNEDINDYFLSIKQKLFFSNGNVQFKKKILFSSMHGTATNYMVNFLTNIGYNVIPYEPQCIIDSEFSNAKVINPELAAAFKESSAYAEENNIDFIFACDPDADRLGVYFKKNNEWHLLSGNQAGIIETYFLLEQEYTNKNQEEIIQEIKPMVISTYVSNNLIDRIIKEYNGEVVRTPTGFKWIANKINNLTSDYKYINGFEEAIGALPSDINRDKDSFQVALLLLEILNYYTPQNYDFIDILEKIIYPKFGHLYSATISIEILDNNWQQKAKEYIAMLESFPGKTILTRKINEIKMNNEGSCLEFILDKDSWIKFRISGTEPKFKIYFNLFNEEHVPSYNLNILKELKEESIDILNFIEQYLEL